MIGAKEHKSPAPGEEAATPLGAGVRLAAPPKTVRRRRGLQVGRLAARELRRQLPVAAACLALGALVRVGLALGPEAWVGHAAELSLTVVALVSGWLLGVATLAPDAESGAQRFLVGLPLGGVKQLLARLLPAAGLAGLVPGLFALLTGRGVPWWEAVGLWSDSTGQVSGLVAQAPGMFAAGVLAAGLTRNTLAAFALTPLLWWGSARAVAGGEAALLQALGEWVQGRSLPLIAHPAVLQVLVLMLLALSVATGGELHQRSPRPGLRAAGRALGIMGALLALALGAARVWDRLGASTTFVPSWGTVYGPDGPLSLRAIEVGGLGGLRAAHPWMRAVDGRGLQTSAGRPTPVATRGEVSLLFLAETPPIDARVPVEAGWRYRLERPGLAPLEFEVPASEVSWVQAVVWREAGTVWLVGERGLFGPGGEALRLPPELELRDWCGRTGLVWRSLPRVGAEPCLITLAGDRLSPPERLEPPPGVTAEQVWLLDGGERLLLHGDGADPLYLGERAPGAPVAWRPLTLPDLSPGWERPRDRPVDPSLNVTCQVGQGSGWALVNLSDDHGSLSALLETGRGAFVPLAGHTWSWLPAAAGLVGDDGLVLLGADRAPEVVAWDRLEGGSLLAGGRPLALWAEPDGAVVLLSRGHDGLFRLDLNARRVSRADDVERALVAGPAEPEGD